MPPEIPTNPAPGTGILGGGSGSNTDINLNPSNWVIRTDSAGNLIRVNLITGFTSVVMPAAPTGPAGGMTDYQQAQLNLQQMLHDFDVRQYEETVLPFVEGQMTVLQLDILATQQAMSLAQQQFDFDKVKFYQGRLDTLQMHADNMQISMAQIQQSAANAQLSAQTQLLTTQMNNVAAAQRQAIAETGQMVRLGIQLDFTEQQNALDRAFQAAESAIGRQFTANENAIDRHFQAVESQIARQFAGEEARFERMFQAESRRLDRKFTSEENRIGRKFTSEENRIARMTEVEEARIGRLHASEENRIEREARAEENRIGRQFQGRESQIGRQFSAEESRIGREVASGENALDRELQAAAEAARNALDISRFELDRHRLGLDAAETFSRVVSSTDPLAFRAFLGAGGGVISNALASGGDALSDAALLPGALGLREIEGIANLAPPDPFSFTPEANPFLGQENRFADLTNEFAAAINQAAQQTNPMAGMTNPFADQVNPFADIQNMFADTTNEFADLQNQFADRFNEAAMRTNPAANLRNPVVNAQGQVGSSGASRNAKIQAAIAAARQAATQAAAAQPPTFASPQPAIPPPAPRVTPPPVTINNNLPPARDGSGIPVGKTDFIGIPNVAVSKGVNFLTTGRGGPITLADFDPNVVDLGAGVFIIGKDGPVPVTPDMPIPGGSPISFTGLAEGGVTNNPFRIVGEEGPELNIDLPNGGTAVVPFDKMTPQARASAMMSAHHAAEGGVFDNPFLTPDSANQFGSFGANLPIDPSLDPFINQVRNLRRSTEIIEGVNPFRADFFRTISPTLRELFFKGRQAKFGIPVADQEFEAARFALPGIARGSIALGR